MSDHIVKALILAFNRDIALEIGEKVQSLEEKTFFKPSEYQQSLIDFVVSGTGNGLVQAVAGSGKTTTILQALNELRLKYQTKQKEIKRIGTYRLLDYGDFTIYPSTQHAFALSLLQHAYGNKIKVDKGNRMIDRILNEYFKTDYKNNKNFGRFFTETSDYNNYPIQELIEHLKDLFPDKEVTDKKGNTVYDDNGNPKVIEIWRKEFKSLNARSKKLCKNMVNSMLSAGVGVLPDLPINMDTARKIYYDYNLEPNISGVRVDRRENKYDPPLWVGRHTEMKTMPNGNKKASRPTSLYDLFQKDRIMEIALIIIQHVYNFNDLTSQPLPMSLFLYKVVQNHENKIGFPAYDFVFQDEAQDTNSITMEFISRLVRRDSNGNPIGRVIGVGDVAQAIYGFRGANSYAMRDFERRFNCTVLPLSTCYRCASSILEKVREIGRMYESIEPVQNAPHGLYSETQFPITSFLERELSIPELDRNGEPVLDRFKNKIFKRVINPFYLGRDFFNEDTAIIARSNNTLRSFAQTLKRKDIPFNLMLSKEGEVGGSGEDDFDPKALVYKFMDSLEERMNFFQDKGIKTKKKWFRFSPARSYFDKRKNKDVEKNPKSYSINWFMFLYKLSMKQRLYSFEQGNISEEQYLEEVEMYVQTIQIMTAVMNKLGQTPFRDTDKIKDAIRPIYQIVINELSIDGSGEGVTLVNAHKSKGLEYPRVIVIRDTFMKQWTKLPRHGDIEASWVQEMNMLYVAMTRAEKELIMVSGASDEASDAERFLSFVTGDFGDFPDYDPSFEPKLKPSNESIIAIDDRYIQRKLIASVKSAEPIGTMQNVSGYNVDPDAEDRYKVSIDVQSFLPRAKFNEKPIVTIRLDDGAVRYEAGDGLTYKLLEQLIDAVKSEL